MNSIFTFHNVSINTELDLCVLRLLLNLHSTMFLLILQTFSKKAFGRAYLHSTMFLLIPGKKSSGQTSGRFTFHNVSINTFTYQVRKEDVFPFTFHNVSINTGKLLNLKLREQFTFHNVSINTPSFTIPYTTSLILPFSVNLVIFFICRIQFLIIL